MFSNLLISCLVLHMVYVWGSGAIALIFFVNSWANLYAGALLQLTTGRIEWSGLCSLIRPLMEGADGFRFICFHFFSGGMSVLLLFMIFLTWAWKESVGSVLEVRKLLVCMNCSALLSYCSVGRITSEFPLSARVIMALLSASFILMFLIVLDSCWVLCACGGLLFLCKVLMRSAVNFLYTSRSDCGSRGMAVSASRASVWSQFFGLLCKLYLGPFCRMVISVLRKICLSC